MAYICFLSQSCCIYLFTVTNGEEKTRRHISKLFEFLIYFFSASGVQQLYLLLLISFCCLCLDGNLSFGLVKAFSELNHIERLFLFHFPSFFSLSHRYQICIMVWKTPYLTPAPFAFYLSQKLPRVNIVQCSLCPGFYFPADINWHNEHMWEN